MPEREREYGFYSTHTEKEGAREMQRGEGGYFTFQASGLCKQCLGCVDDPMQGPALQGRISHPPL